MNGYIGYFLERSKKLKKDDDNKPLQPIDNKEKNRDTCFHQGGDILEVERRYMPHHQRR